MSLAMTKAEREAFLAGVHVGVLSVARPERGPLLAPIWYRYEPGGDVCIVTGRSSAKARHLARAGRASLCVQTETTPYRYLTVEGPVTLGEIDFTRDVRDVAYRYLGQKTGDAYLAATADWHGPKVEVLVRLRPEHWQSEDYGKTSVLG
jgi:PPOX class probable F420-dependent enzyme